MTTVCIKRALSLWAALCCVPLAAQHRVSLAPFPNAPKSERRIETLDARKQAIRDADKWLASDKAKHLSLSFALVLIAKAGAKEGMNFDRAASSASAAGATLLAGFAKEVIDDLNPNNIFSLKDLAADLLGVLLALALLSMVGY